MNESFLDIKARRFAEAIINSVVTALSVGALCFGAMLLAFKISAVDFPLIYHILIACGAGIVAGLVTFLIKYKSPMRLAKEIDNDHNLGERIQTMVAFENKDSDILALQRNDAESALARLNTVKPFSKRFGASVVAFVLAIAIMTPAVLIPKATPIQDDDTTPPTYEEPFELNNNQREALVELINSIKEMDKSEIDETLQTEIVTELERLLAVLENTKLVSLMKSEVIASIMVVDLATEKLLTYKLVAEALFRSKTDAQVRNIAKSIVKVNGKQFGLDMDEIRPYYDGDTVIENEDEEEPIPDGTEGAEPTSLTKDGGNTDGDEVAPPTDDDKQIITLAMKLDSLSSEIPKLLDDNRIPEDDKLKLELIAFADEILAIKSTTNADQLQSLIDFAFDSVTDRVSGILNNQYENQQIAKTTVIQRLCDIFGISEGEVPELLINKVPELIESESGENAGDSSSGVSGGYGKGDELYGSNDTIYDPFAAGGAGYVKYGDAYDDYYRRIEELIAPGNTSVSEETKKILMTYFHKLSDGSGN